MATDQRIWVGSLSAYNSGTLHGRWIDVGDALEATDGDTTKAAALVMDEVRAMLSDCPEHGEEWEAMDWEGVSSSVDLRWESFDEVCSLFLGVREHGLVFAEWGSEYSSWSEALELFDDHYGGSYDSLDDYGEQRAEDMGLLVGVDESLVYHFDFERWARDMEMGGSITTYRVGGVLHVFYPQKMVINDYNRASS